MAKADDTPSTIDWILLPVALAELAVEALGSVALAKELLVQWMVAGKLPWSCVSWEGPNAAWIAMLEKINSQLKFRRLPVASAAYRNGDPEFLRAATIDWENNTAQDKALGGAKAWAMQISRTHLIALLPEEPRDCVEAQGAAVWISAEVKRMKKADAIPPDITLAELSRRLESRMLKAADTDKSLRPIKAGTIRNGLRNWGLWPVTSSK